MTKASISALLLEVMGIYSIIQAIGRVGSLIQGLSISGGMQGERYWFLGAGISFLLLLGLGLVLLIFARKISGEPEKPVDMPASRSISAEDFHAMALSVIGVLVLVLALHELVLFGGTLFAFKSAQSEWQKEKYQIDTIVGVIRLLFLFAVGLWLFFRGRCLTTFWFSLRQKLR